MSMPIVLSNSQMSVTVLPEAIASPHKVYAHVENDLFMFPRIANYLFKCTFIFFWLCHLTISFLFCFCLQMDTLISQGSKSYYACVGESTHAYQSPSKDLSAINNRLNAGYVHFPDEYS